MYHAILTMTYISPSHTPRISLWMVCPGYTLLAAPWIGLQPCKKLQVLSAIFIYIFLVLGAQQSQSYYLNTIANSHRCTVHCL